MYKAIADNKRNTLVIMIAFVALIGAIGWAVGYYYGDPSITYTVLIVSIAYALIQYYAASKIAVAMTGARQIEKKDNPRLYRIVENLAITIGAPTPKIYIIDDVALNAFATGRDPKHAVVAATTGLLDAMTDSELEAVMAHEMGHVQNYDIRLSMIIFGLVSAIGLLSDIALRTFIHRDSDDNNNSPIVMIIGVVLVVLAPVIALVIQLAVSRQREYLADATSAMTTRNPDSMVSALRKLRDNNQPMQRQSTASAHLFIANPLKKSAMGKLFSTHPPIEERIARLEGNRERF